MKKQLSFCIICFLAFAACKKNAIEAIAFSPSYDTAIVTTSICPWTCRITDFPYKYYSLLDGDSYDENEHSGDLFSLLDGHLLAHSFQYDATDKLIYCGGELSGACWSENFSDSFYYNADQKLQTLLVHKLYTTDPWCPNAALNNHYWNIKCDFTYGLRFKIVNNVLIPVKTITGTISQSDTVLSGNAVNHYTPTGESYYYELINDRLSLKRHTKNAGTTPVECRYYYNSSANVSLVEISNQGGPVLNNIVFTQYDNKHNIVRGNEVWQLLVGDYSLNNPTSWYRNGTEHSTAVYQYNSFCFPRRVIYHYYNEPPEDYKPDVQYICE